MTQASPIEKRAARENAVLSPAAYEYAMFGANEFAHWIIANSVLKGTTRKAALILAHEYNLVNTTGGYTVYLEQGRSELAAIVGCHAGSIQAANRAIRKSGEWEIIAGTGTRATVYRPSQRVIDAILANRMGK
ncbi:hypothetical protein [Arthrobacter sp. SO3]|uniref:hypothetical protein n=1 Tax=Arthrobacter sp. SO3 TaxID=1897057 RepID=UPI001CFF63A6|nr:hypothetical protein [Arthrobacter sp. SO3]MCB5292029.1 hypothetical protein [Arthrobacter sp. SO3]